MKKGYQWHFNGMKAHIGVDADSGLLHAVVGTVANDSDVTQAHALVHGRNARSFAMRITGTWRNARRRRPSKLTGMWPCAPVSVVRWTKSTAAGVIRHRGKPRTPQGMYPHQGRTSVSSHQAPVRLRQGALPRADEEHGATAHAVRALQPVDGSLPTFAGRQGMSAPARRQGGAKKRPECAVGISLPTDTGMKSTIGFIA